MLSFLDWLRPFVAIALLQGLLEKQGWHELWRTEVAYGVARIAYEGGAVVDMERIFAPLYPVAYFVHLAAAPGIGRLFWYPGGARTMGEAWIRGDA
jgi:hypothetical protein